MAAHSAAWQINMKTTNCDNFDTCSKTLIMYFGESIVVATGEDINVNGVQLAPGVSYLAGGLILLILRTKCLIF